MATSRRSFLVATGKVMVLLPVGYAFANTIGCGGSDDNNDGGGGGACDAENTVNNDGTQLIVTSGCVGDHTHDFTIQDADLTTPPASGVSGNSSSAEGHMHLVALTEADLESIEAGNTVSKVSASTNSHTHTFQFKKAAAAAA